MSNPRFGIHLPNSGGGAVSPDSLVEYKTIRKIALEAEKLGFDSVWANEHLTLPTDQTPTETKFFEPLTLLSSIASETRKINLGTAIVILPFRDPFVLAKEAGTLAEISGDRFILGVGPGRFEREYSVQNKNWKERNKKLEEQIAMIRELVSGKPFQYSGKFFSANGFSMRPIPGKMPIVLGGSSAIAVSRAVRLCDGIMPGHITVDEAESINRSITLELGSDKNRTERGFTFYNEMILSIDEDSEKARSKFLASTYVRKVQYATDLSSKALVGTPREVISKITQYADVGVREFILIFADETETEFIESMRLFSTKVLNARN